MFKRTLKVSDRFSVFGLTQYIGVFIHCFGSSRLAHPANSRAFYNNQGVGITVMLLSKNPEFSITNAASYKILDVTKHYM